MAYKFQKGTFKPAGKLDLGSTGEAAADSIVLAAGAIENADLAAISAGNKVEASAIELKANSALEDDSGLALKSNIAGDGLALTASGGNQVLSVGVDDSSIEINSDSLRVKASGVTNNMLAGSIANAKLANSSVTLAGQGVALGGSITSATLAGALALDDIGVPDAAVSLNSQKITSLATPTADADAATKAYVDSVASGLDIKESVKVATTGNITLSGTQTIDGVGVLADDRVLVKDQTTASQNGIYLCKAGAWQRATDFAASNQEAGAFCFVEQGTVNGDNGFVCTSNKGADVVGTDALAFSQFSGAGDITAGAAMTKSGNTLDVAVDDSSIEVSSDALRVKALGVTNAMLAGSIANAKLANSTISGVALGANLNDLTVDDATIRLDSGTTFNGSAGRTISIKDGGVDADALNSSVAGAGLSGGGGSALSIDAAQTGITSILATDLKIGEDDQTKIDFGETNKIEFYANNNKHLTLEENSLKFDRGSLHLKVREITTNAASSALDAQAGQMIIAAPTGSGLVVQLPQISGASLAGLFYTIKNKNTGSTTVAVATNGSEEIESSSSNLTLEPGAAINCVCDGVRWHVY